jgi:hypothetical protein
MARSVYPQGFEARVRDYRLISIPFGPIEYSARKSQAHQRASWSRGEGNRGLTVRAHPRRDLLVVTVCVLESRR